MVKYIFTEALDDKLSDESTIYVFKFKSISSEGSKEISYSSNDPKCLFKVLKVTAELMGEDLSEVSTDDFFAIAAGYTEIEGEFQISETNELIRT